MGLRFIYGRAGSGKTEFCLREIKSRIEEGGTHPLMLLVPEDYSFQAEKKLLKCVGDKGLMRAQVLSFKRMAYRVFSEVGGLTRQHMNTAGRCMLIYRTMEKHKDEFKVYGRAVRQQGFVDTVSDMITEFKIYDISPEELKETAARIEGRDILKDKLHDISLIYWEFENALHENYIDSEDDLSLLRGKMDECSLFDGAEVWIDGFSMMTPQQLNIIEKLMQKACRVNVTLCTDYLSGGRGGDSTDIFSPIKNMEGKILKIAESANTGREKPVRIYDEACQRFKDSSEIYHLERNYSTYPWERFEKETEDITLFKAANKYTEIQSIARDIISLCRDKGLRYKDIAVVARDTKGYERLIGAIFSEFQIPYFLDQKKDISDNPIVVLIVSAIEIFNKNWSYEAVFKYLKTNLSGLQREEIDLIENYVLTWGIKGRRWTDGKDWDFWHEKDSQGELSTEDLDSLNKINHIKNKVVCPLTDFYSQVKGRKKAREISAALFEFLCAIGVPAVIENLVEKFKEERELSLGDEYSKVWNMLMDALDQVVKMVGEEEMDLNEYARVLTTGLKEYKIGLIPPSVDQVTFGSVERLKSHEIKALYVIGVNDGIFPAVSSEEGILNDRDREMLKNMGISLAPDTREMVFEEEYLIYTTLTSPQKYLKISYSLADHEGKAMRPSRIISRLKKIFPYLTEDGGVTGAAKEDIKLISSPGSTFNELISALRRGDDSGELSPLWKDVYSWYVTKEDWRDSCKRALSAFSYSNQVKPVNPGKIRGLYGKQVQFSVSRLEKFAKCPFSYFVQYGLKARERKVFELSPPDLGSFIHTVLDKFSTYIDEKKISWRDLDREWCREAISQIVDNTVEGTSGSIFKSSARYKYLKDRLKKVIERAVWLISLHIKKGGFDPEGHEILFGEKGKYPPISIELPSGEKINLIGRIDRIDTMEREEGVYVRIVDYKTGDKTFNLSDIYNGLELQLLIYLDAILEYGAKNKDKRVIPGGILYFRIDDPLVKSQGDLDEESLEKEIMKRLKMRGLLLSDVKVVKEMDRGMDRYSLIIPAILKSDGTLDARSQIAALEDFQALRKRVKKMIVGLCEDMLKGNISISPYKSNKETPCKYCSYRPVCRFDVTIKENSYRIIRSLKKDEVWDAVRQEGGEI